MKVCIAEKPSVASEIAEILGAKTRKDGYFEGNGYQVTWTFGHLCTLFEPHDYKMDWKQWKIGSLPIIPDRFDIKLINNQGVSKQFNTIKSLFDKCDEVINCGDAGIEGELIQRWVLSKAGCKKPLKRLWISSLTEEAIREGFNTLKNGEEYNRLYYAGYARAIGDWLLGMNATRLYTLKYANNKGILSIGRVQTPTLALIVERQKQIDAFVPEKYWELKTNYKNVIFSSDKGKFKSIEDAQKIIEAIKNELFTIDSFSRKKGTEAPPKLLDLTSLQVEANKKYGYSAEDTLKITQRLYERKFLTYPRVDTTFLPNDMYPKIEGIMQKLPMYQQFTQKVLSQKIIKPKRIFDDSKVTDHHAIIPTGVVANGLSTDEENIYDLVARRFIANFYPDCIISNTVVTGSTGKISFKATGKQIIEENWRELYPKKANEKNEANDKSESDENTQNQIIPDFEKGESGPHKPFYQEKNTQPPKPYTEATLLRAMETAGKQVDNEELRDLMKENGIGRPSTRANIIETLFKRNYIVKQRKNLFPTITGIQLIETIKNDLLKSVELTGMWEKKLRDIEYGHYEAKHFIDEMKVMVSNLIKEVMSETSSSITIAQKAQTAKTTTSNTETNAIICPKCKQGNIIKGNTAYGCSNFKNGCNFKIPFVINGKKLTEKQIFSIIKNGKSAIIKGFVNGNKTQSGIISLNNNFEISIDFEEDAPKTPKAAQLICPHCKKGTMLRGNKAYGCSRYKEGCNYIISFAQLKEKFGNDILTDEILKTLNSK